MEWRGRRESQNIEDRRGMSVGRAGGVGGVGVVALLVVGYFLGIDVTPLLNDPALTGGGVVSSSDEITKIKMRACFSSL